MRYPVLAFLAGLTAAGAPITNAQSQQPEAAPDVPQGFIGMGQKIYVVLAGAHCGFEPQTDAAQLAGDLVTLQNQLLSLGYHGQVPDQVIDDTQTFDQAEVTLGESVPTGQCPIIKTELIEVLNQMKGTN
jgi:hypothetical protein